MQRERQWDKEVEAKEEAVNEIVFIVNEIVFIVNEISFHWFNYVINYMSILFLRFF